MSLAGEIGSATRARPPRVLGWQEQVFALAIVIVPLMGSPLMQVQLLPMAGMKLPNIVAGLAFLAFVQNPGKLARTDRLGRIAFFGFLAFAAFFLLDFVRSVPNLPTFHVRFAKSVPAGLREYAESVFVVPLLLACSFVYILRRMCNSEGLTLVLQAISMSAFLLSCTVLVAVALSPDALFDTSPTRQAILKLTDDTLGLHYNSVSGMFAIVAPILLYMALKRGSFWTANYALALTAVLMLKSRTGLLTFGGISVVTMIVLGRARELVAAAPVIVIAALAALGPMLIHLLSIGFTQKSGISADILLSGREQSIWIPLLFEWFQDSHKLFFGQGLFGVRTSDVLFTGFLFPAGEAHNVYLEFFLDNGIFLFGVFIAGLVAWLIWSTRMARRLKNGLFWVLYLCVISFLISGFSGRHYFPNPDDFFVFPIMAALINVARLKLGPVANKPAAVNGNLRLAPNVPAEIR